MSLITEITKGLDALSGTLGQKWLTQPRKGKGTMPWQDLALCSSIRVLARFQVPNKFQGSIPHIGQGASRATWRNSRPRLAVSFHGRKPSGPVDPTSQQLLLGGPTTSIGGSTMSNPNGYFHPPTLGDPHVICFLVVQQPPMAYSIVRTSVGAQAPFLRTLLHTLVHASTSLCLEVLSMSCRYSTKLLVSFLSC